MMSALTPVNCHGTAIVAGNTGLLFLAPSGGGKSELAFACLGEARAAGLFAALIADDRVLVEQAGEAIVASAPPATAGMIELRGAGIAAIGHMQAAVMHLAVIAGDASGADRLPPDSEQFEVAPGLVLPAIRLRPNMRRPLATIAALRPSRLAL